MDWKFTPLQVLSGEITYSIYEYREALNQEIRNTLAEFDLTESTLRVYCDLMYIMFYWFAVNGSPQDLKKFYEVHLTDDFAFKETLTNMAFILETKKENEGIVDMLRAVLMRMATTKLEEGASLGEARKFVEAGIGIYFNSGA
ncbi:MAG: hypothetical protein L3V56_04335 [Candidatus Magnetoovum sp. WYHC-5]|nr:hypothetical protein [Candidatus Magnetoovum sp. WYHC-5]